MSPGRYDLNLYRGDTYAWRFQLWEECDRAEPVDLTGAVAAAEIRDEPAGAVVMALDCSVTPPNIVDVALAADLWAGFAPPAGIWDLQLTYPAGDVQTPIYGLVGITDDVTGSTP